jgi:glycosyltransferase involved in cell wall biosynthesis
MFNRDPSPEIEATSWRVSLRACLVRTEVLRKMGFLRPEFSTVEAAALEWGHRLLARGVLMRHAPQLLDQRSEARGQRSVIGIPFEDELRFVYYCHGRKWAGWALFRAVMTRYTSLRTALRAWRSIMTTPRPPEPPPFRASGASSQWSVVSSPIRSQPSTLNSQLGERVSVLIPTVDRYPYLRTLLYQLRRQTVPPCEIIIVDQTASGERDVSLAKDFPDLPLRIINQDEAGQCASRNAGLQIMSGDCVLFIDDDDEVDPDLIERHLHTLAEFDADSSSGIADEVGAENVKPATGMLRSSDVFPTGNTLAKRAALEKSGLFDLAYNRGQNEDGDLGMRFYLSGARMVLNTDISVLHHHAPSGGLRKHKARVVTYASSRQRLLHRNLPSSSEIYLGNRYFSKVQVREAVWLRVLGTFSTRGGYFRKAIKVSLSAILLLHTMWVIRKSWKKATAMLAEFPNIPKLSPPSSAPGLSSAQQLVTSGSGTGD